MVAVTQVAHRHSEGRAYYDRKLKESKTNEEALRSVRRICDAIFARLVADAKRKSRSRQGGPGRAKGERLCLQRGRLTPRARYVGITTVNPALYRQT